MLGVSSAAAVPAGARYPALPPRLPHEVTLASYWSTLYEYSPLIGQYSKYLPLIGQGDSPGVRDTRGEPLPGGGLHLDVSVREQCGHPRLLPARHHHPLPHHLPLSQVRYLFEVGIRKRMNDL